MLQAALFDMDGTLVDNLSYHIASWEAFSQRHHLPFSLDFFYQHLNGRNSRDTLRLLFGRELSDKEVQHFTEEKEEIYRAAYRPHLQPLKGAVKLLTELQKKGVKLAVATSAPLSNVEFTLDGAGLSHFFEVVVYGGMVRRGKPDPEIYQLTAEKLGVEPRDCLVFEDALLGIESARRAGMAVVGLTTSHPAEEFRFLTIAQFATFEGTTFEGLKAKLNEYLNLPPATVIKSAAKDLSR